MKHLKNISNIQKDTKSKEEFHQLKNQLYSISSAEQITYFDNNWLHTSGLRLNVKI